MKQEFYSNLNNVEVVFKDKKHNYFTDISGDVTEVEAKKYFINKLFNVGIYPKENLQKCISIKFYKNPKNKGLKGTFSDPKKSKQGLKASNDVPIKLNWKKHEDGYEYCTYKFGSIVKNAGKFQINYFGTIGVVSRTATSLLDAKKKLDKLSEEKTKKQGLKGFEENKNNKGLVLLLKNNIKFWKKELNKKNVSIDNKKYFENEIKENEKVILNLQKQGLKANLSIRAIAKSVSVTGLKKSDGTLKKGYKYQVQKNGKTKIVKVVKKPIAKKKVIKKKATKTK